MKLAREGWEIVAVVGGVAAAVSVLVGMAAAVPLWGLWLLVVQFFREPARMVNARAVAAGGVLAVADGRVVHVGPGKSPLDGRDRLKISVFMNVFNVHVNLVPVSGRVVHSQRFAGGFFNAALDKVSEENERHLIVIEVVGGGVVECMQVAGLLARRVLCYAEMGGEVRAGERYGFIRFGSRVDLYLPLDWQPRVRLGDRTVAGVTEVAEPGAWVGTNAGG